MYSLKEEVADFGKNSDGFYLDPSSRGISRKLNCSHPGDILDLSRRTHE